MGFGVWMMVWNEASVLGDGLDDGLEWCVGVRRMVWNGLWALGRRFVARRCRRNISCGGIRVYNAHTRHSAGPMTHTGGGPNTIDAADRQTSADRPSTGRPLEHQRGIKRSSASRLPPTTTLLLRHYRQPGPDRPAGGNPPRNRGCEWASGGAYWARVHVQLAIQKSSPTIPSML